MKDDYKSNEKDKNEEGESDDDYCVEIDNLNIILLKMNQI